MICFWCMWLGEGWGRERESLLFFSNLTICLKCPTLWIYPSLLLDMYVYHDVNRTLWSMFYVSIDLFSICFCYHYNIYESLLYIWIFTLYFTLYVNIWNNQLAHCNPLDIYIYIYIYNTIYMYSGITSGRVLNGELLYTKILEVNLFAFAYRLFRRDFFCSMPRRVGRNLYETVCRQMQTN